MAMKIFRSTKNNQAYWKNRKIDWKAHYGNWNHPHRFVITQILKQLNWLSLIEIGCGAGANLLNILKAIPGRQLGGIDINQDAIDYCNKVFQGALFKAGSMDDVMMSDKSTDVVLSDMSLIYVDPSKIEKYLGEVKRITRNYVVLCELHSTSWWNRLAVRWNEGYQMYDYEKLLTKMGFYDMLYYKLKKEDWPESSLQQKFGYIIVAKVPRR
jgi:ubiquinone/menaquinone biosynthesis C-methylase UbiE